MFGLSVLLSVINNQYLNQYSLYVLIYNLFISLTLCASITTLLLNFCFFKNLILSCYNL